LAFVWAKPAKTQALRRVVVEVVVVVVAVGAWCPLSSMRFLAEDGTGDVIMGLHKGSREIIA
jgi:hypothetical protein